MRAGGGIKPSSEERSGKRKKRSKQKSSKRRRRERSPSSASSYSSSSLSDDDSPALRKTSRRREQRKPAARSPSPKRRRDLKKVEKRKARKTRSRRRKDSVSSGSSGSRSCSTCRGSSLDRSRSPVERSGRSKSRRERGRRRSTKRTNERYRSPSCSTGSEDSGRSGSRERYKEKGGSRRLRSMVRKNEDEMVGRLESKDEDQAKIIKAYDDFQSSRSNQNSDAGRDREPRREEDTVGRKRKEQVIESKVNVELPNDSVDGGKYFAGEAVSGNDHFTKEEDNVVAAALGSEADDLEVILRQKALENFRKYRSLANNKSLGDLNDETGQKESGKNLGRIEETKQSSHSSRIAATKLDRKSSGSLEEQKLNAIESWQPEAKSSAFAYPLPRMPRLRSRVEKVPQNATDCGEHDNDNSNSVAHLVVTMPKETEEPRTELKKADCSSKKQSPEQASPSQVVQKGDAGDEAGSANISLADVNKANEPPSEVAVLPKLDPGNSNSNEPVLKAATGSQFEQKTFSRVHDGEMVQVSYKVYIPKKTPALARRQLQR